MQPLEWKQLAAVPTGRSSFAARHASAGASAKQGSAARAAGSTEAHQEAPSAFRSLLDKMLGRDSAPVRAAPREGNVDGPDRSGAASLRAPRTGGFPIRPTDRLWNAGIPHSLRGAVVADSKTVERSGADSFDADPPLQRVSRSPGAARPRAVAYAKRELAAAIERAARSAGVDPALGVAVARAESSLDPSAVAFDGLSRGTFQVLPSTQREVRARIRSGDIPRPAGNEDVALGVGYLRHLDDLLREGGNLPGGREVNSIAATTERRKFVAAAYNAGPGRVAWAQEQAREHGLDPRRFSSIERWLPGITRKYVPRVVGFHGEESKMPTAVEA